jgi:predicted RNase H-like nuclease
VRYLGIDLAWGEGSDIKPANRSGVVTLDEDGSITDAGWTIGLDATVAWIETQAQADTMLFVDAPLVIENETGQREAERQVGVGYGRAWVSANSTNRGSPRQAGLLLLRRLCDTGWRYDDGRRGPAESGRTVSECYPYATIVGVDEFGYERRPAYKRARKGLPASTAWPIRTEACDGLIARIAGLASHAVPVDLRSHPKTRELIDVRSPPQAAAYKHREDLLDAVICAWTAALWHRQPDRFQILGETSGAPSDRPMATIIAPARPGQRVNA